MRHLGLLRRHYFLLITIIVYLIVGAVGHDPWWRRGEAYSFGIIHHFYVTHTWLVPFNAGSPFMEKPPLYYWVAVLFCRALGDIIPLYDAARLASPLFMAITATFTYFTASVLFHKHADSQEKSLQAMLLFLGSYGLCRHGHSMITDVALLAGTSIALYGLAVLVTTPHSWKNAGFWLGVGVGIAFMSKGIFVPGVIALTSIGLLIFMKQLRTVYFLKTFLLAFLAASPFLLIWPLLLYMHSPDLFNEWFWTNNVGRFTGTAVEHLGAQNRPGYFLWMAPIFIFPSLVLALARAIYDRKQWREPDYLLPGLLSVIGMIILLVSASGRAPYLMPLIPGFALLATPLLSQFSEKTLFYWNSFARIGFGIAVMVVWLLWWSLLQPEPHPLPWLLAYYYNTLSPDFAPKESQLIPFCFALFFLCIWISSLFLFGKKTATETMLNWFSGVMLMWGTICLLLMPWLNHSFSFRTPLTQIIRYIDSSPYKGSCIGNYNLGENVAPIMQYFTGNVLPLQTWEETTCPLILTFVEKDKPVVLHPEWQILWKESQIRDIKNMEIRLYERKK